MVSPKLKPRVRPILRRFPAPVPLPSKSHPAVKQTAQAAGLLARADAAARQKR
jgi:hypothetical protein